MFLYMDANNVCGYSQKNHSILTDGMGKLNYCL